jgi:hypothetical protein
MKRVLAIALLVWALAAQAEKVTLAWTASASPEVSGYQIYFGTNTGRYMFVTNAGLVLTQTVVLPHGGRWFFAATAYNSNHLESPFSAEVQWQSRPQPPVLAGVNVVRICPVIERSTNLVDWAGAAGEPTFFAATNPAEFFRARRLTIENVKRVE